MVVVPVFPLPPYFAQAITTQVKLFAEAFQHNRFRPVVAGEVDTAGNSIGSSPVRAVVLKLIAGRVDRIIGSSQRFGVNTCPEQREVTDVLVDFALGIPQPFGRFGYHFGYA